ncbi:hypothetical protein EUA94_14715 [Nocardioides zhouii]|uniref:Uncharacterized protein n=1 Tax=Nocardioides zhouii TaxID=1168729 RepID=A0A4Q2SP31_9ACTN|nr:hypothetical protein EUA94_14715 [Nocardioides zhouii]
MRRAAWCSQAPPRARRCGSAAAADRRPRRPEGCCTTGSRRRPGPRRRSRSRAAHGPCRTRRS